jgi:hypothetical protein
MNIDRNVTNSDICDGNNENKNKDEIHVNNTYCSVDDHDIEIIDIGVNVNVIEIMKNLKKNTTIHF